MSLKHYLGLLILFVSVTGAAVAQQTAAPEPQTGTITGTVVDVLGGVVPAANVVLDGPSPSDRQRVVTNDNGSFQIGHLKPGTTYHVTVTAQGFADSTSPPITV